MDRASTQDATAAMTLETSISETIFAPHTVFPRIGERLSFGLPMHAFDAAVMPSHGDHKLNPTFAAAALAAGARAAAVLVPLVAYADAVTVLLTQRASALRVHSGQIAFPGGKIDSGDTDPVAAALREAHEEIGLAETHIEPLGYLDPYQTRTGYRIMPVVARITPPFDLEINKAEVDRVFEVPLAFLMDEANHALQSAEWLGATRYFYAMPYGDYNIWGVTAGIVRNLYERLYS